MSALAQAREIGVFRALQLGDLLCAVPALRALRAAAPRARITLIGLAWAQQLTARLARYLDDFIVFPGWPGFPEQPCAVGALPAFLQLVHARRFDVALQMHGSGRLSNPLVAAFGARQAAGFFVPGEYCPEDGVFLPWRETHEIRRWVELVSALGAPPQGLELEFPITAADRRTLEANTVLRRLSGTDYVVVHPGAQLASRRWPFARFAAVADALAADGYVIVLTGTANETPLTRSVAAAMRAPALDAAGQTTLGAAAALIDGARLLIANDTGVGHVAAACRTPSVIAACGSDVTRWAPLDTALHRVLHHQTDCRPCAHARCPHRHECADGVSAEAVIGAARELLAAHARSARRLDACAG
jgi:ADP-heptose:LPS heptosyltransferase